MTTLAEPAERSAIRRVGGLTTIRLQGSAEQIGQAHGQLLYEPMLRTELAVWELFAQYVPRRLARRVLLQLGRFRYRKLAADLAANYRRELQALARAFRPDPFEQRMNTAERLVLLNALYDISLAFERSPLPGCTSFVLAEPARQPGALLCRTFDFDAHPIFDREKVVFFVHERGKLPYASIGWAGLCGVVSGLNAAGLAIVVHGARAGRCKTRGETVVGSLKRVLQTATDAEQAVHALSLRPPLVSHLLVVADAAGRALAIERVPEQPSHLRELGPRAVVTNHLAGPAAGDPRNQRILRETSSLARYQRGLELLQRSGTIDVPTAIGWLRDRKAVGDRELAPGDRRAIDADIAGHGVVFDTARRKLWVSEGPHLSGRFIELDMADELGAQATLACASTSSPPCKT